MLGDAVPWWIWLLIPLVQVLTGAAVEVCMAIAYRRAVGTWPPFAGWLPGVGHWTVRITVERRQ
jgi:hypothetical protein